MFLKSQCVLKTVTPIVLALGMISPAAAEFRFTPYGSIGGNFSFLSPDAGNSGFDVTDENSVGLSVLLGADIFDRWSIEAGYNDLGNATLESTAGAEEEITYSALSFSVLFHLFGNARDIAERRGGWAYLRLGASQIENDSNLLLEEEDSAAVWAGVGYEYSFNSFLSVRGELATFDGDAQAITAAVVFRPFSPPSSSRGSVANAPTTPTRPAIRPAPLPAPTPSQNPQRLPIPNAPTAPSAPSVGVPSTRVAGCESPVGNEPIGVDGCALLSGVRPGIQFANESPRLLPESLSAIATLASAMNQAPNLRVEIHAHAESVQGDSASQELARQRVVAVARALVAAGVDVSRLGARAFGNQQPIVGRGAAIGQALPNRVEFVVRP